MTQAYNAFACNRAGFEIAPQAAVLTPCGWSRRMSAHLPHCSPDRRRCTAIIMNGSTEPSSRALSVAAAVHRDDVRDAGIP